MDNGYNQKQLEIMDTSLQLFARNGFDKTSVRDIAKKAKVNVAMIFYYFSSKEKLLEAIFGRYIQHVRATLEQIVNDRQSHPADKIDQIIDAYINAITQNGNFHMLMIREQVVVKNKNLYKVITEMKNKNFELIQNAVKLGEKMGYFRKDIDVKMLALTLFGTINQAFSNRKYLGEYYGLDLTDEAAFNKVVIEKLRSHLKLMFRNFLSNEKK